jgi:2-hydroxychromene-2-carboxylate isomerase
MLAQWYYDPISPYAYLQVERLHELPAAVELEFRPVLFAGLLEHWGQLGPAEVPPKRLFTYRHILWLARRQGSPLRMPASHPFNPLPLLRMGCVLGDDLAAVRRLFRFVWVDGGDPGDPDQLRALALELGIADPGAWSTAEVKAQLLRHGADAIADGVFGVPTLVCEAGTFWGQDSIAMVTDCLRHPDRHRSVDLAALAALPEGASRRRRRTP